MCAGYSGEGDVARTTAARLLTNAHIRAAIDAGLAGLAGLAELRQTVQEETGVFKANLVRVCSEMLRFTLRLKPWRTTSVYYELLRSALTSPLTCALVTRASLGRVAGLFRSASALRTSLRTGTCVPAKRGNQPGNQLETVV